MKVYYSVDEIPPIKNPVLTIGTFDGVHIGHQEIIALLKESAQEIDGETVLFTFHPHPRMVLHPTDHGMKLIQSIEDRIKKLAFYGIDHLILFPFSFEFSRLSATEFVRDILVNKINIKRMTIGYNHHFGRNREGNLILLKELGEVYDFDVQEIGAISENNVNISSTKIRQAIETGELQTAASYLGEPFQFTGTVVHGDHLGTTIGFPTANLELLNPHQIIPKNGAYAVLVDFDGVQLKGMMNIGIRPTVTEKEVLKIEVHIFDFNSDIYGETIRIHVIEHLRDEQMFESLVQLKNQLADDKITSALILDRFVAPDRTFAN